MWTAAVKPLEHLTSLSLCGQLAVPAAAAGLRDLQQLSCVLKRVSLGALTLGTAVAQDHKWLARCSSLTRLQLDCYVSRLDVSAIAALKQLRSLTLCYSGSEKIYASELQLLTACKQLTALELDSFVLSAAAEDSDENPRSSPTAAAAAVGGGGTGSLQVAPSSTASSEQQQQQLLQLQRQQSSSSRQAPAWQLSSLQKLSVGNIGVAVFHAPICTLAPNLTELSDVSDSQYHSGPSSACGLLLASCCSERVQSACVGQLQMKRIDMCNALREPGIAECCVNCAGQQPHCMQDYCYLFIHSFLESCRLLSRMPRVRSGHPHASTH